MSEENKENMQQNEGVKINIKSPEAEVAENAEELQEAENQAEETDMGGGEIGILKKQVENLENILKEKNEEILRRAADLDNYRKRLTKETEDKVRFANQAVVKDFLPVIDNIEMALQHTEEGSPLREGIMLTIKSFKDVLSRHGVTEINSEIGTVFDPAVHEAIMMDNLAEYENNTVTLCVQKGYILNDRVIRPAKVKVNKI
ncbi:nucleotide exchange factor GrpE [Mucispirillum schaedleri]|jgi:molecular chaperone GrpE|uniref:Protein GrpE n=1 Tax=Mucispirillum schaedleri ASF457 TaxID=1379858 RepID=V2QBF2_9BACT|nr:nucleotide exchange factor GrpE [Mucispirillum schaedleri]MCX4360740.1 nucleotide exchange factor GrpE [Mucispirillum schaedleri]USF24733.1 Protein GrpE [Mucispirillum schaedleri ASF457]SIW05721.1 Protein GrpE [Mucispirillum schaedleri ASF457]